jgi:hypothetical protein
MKMLLLPCMLQVWWPQLPMCEAGSFSTGNTLNAKRFVYHMLCMCCCCCCCVCCRFGGPNCAMCEAGSFSAGSTCNDVWRMCHPLLLLLLLLLPLPCAAGAFSAGNTFDAL